MLLLKGYNLSKENLKRKTSEQKPIVKAIDAWLKQLKKKLRFIEKENSLIEQNNKKLMSRRFDQKRMAQRGVMKL